MTKFDHISSSLAPELATKARDLILRFVLEQPYDLLITTMKVPKELRDKNHLNSML